MSSSVTKFQIGKNGVTEGVINSLIQDLKYHRRIRVSCLKSSGRDKSKIKEIAEEIIKKLPVKVNYRIIGFTIIFIKQ